MFSDPISELELLPDKTFATRQAARLAVFDYIEASYNHTRMHSVLDYRSPARYEERFNRLRYVPQVHCPRNPGRSTLTPFLLGP